jgi:hypothetical protein
MGHTAGRGRFGGEWEGDLSVQLYVKQTSRKLLYDPLYRRPTRATCCYPEALLSFILSPHRRNHKTIPRIKTRRFPSKSLSIRYWLSLLGVVFLLCISANCICLACIVISYVYLLYLMCICCTIFVLLFLL